MKNPFAKTVVLLLSAFLLGGLTGGCDRVRASLGKPTSADLEAIRQLRDAHEKAVRDSIEAAKVEIARLEAERAEAEAAAAAAVVKRYYAVAGAFQQEAGAQHFIDKLQEKGFRVRTFDFKNGLKVVCIEGSDALDDVRKDVAALREMKLSDSDPWIYNTNQKLHK